MILIGYDKPGTSSGNSRLENTDMKISEIDNSEKNRK